MLPKDKFCKLLRQFHELVKDAHGAHKSLKKLDPDFGGLSLGRHETMICSLLCELMEDNTKESWISYWIYELEWGVEAKKRKVTCHGKNYTLQTPEQLYNFMTHALCQNTKPNGQTEK